MERMAEVVQEIPCRDTDPLPGVINSTYRGYTENNPWVHE